MSDAIEVTETIRVPAGAIAVRAVRASGPGGQNVNKLATKVELRVDPARIEGLSDAARARLIQLARGRLDAEGRLVVTSQTTRAQARNLENAREKMAALIRAALPAPVPRRPTAPSAGARRRRLEGKKRTGQMKRWRARPSAAD